MRANAMGMQTYLSDTAMSFTKSAAVLWMTVLSEWICFLLFVKVRGTGRAQDGIKTRRSSRSGVALPVRFYAARAFGLLLLCILVQYRFWPVAYHCTAMMVLWTVFLWRTAGCRWHEAVCESCFFCLLLEFGKSFFRDGILARILFLIWPEMPVHAAGWISVLFYFVYMGLMLFGLKLLPSRYEVPDPGRELAAAFLFPVLVYLFVRQFRSSIQTPLNSELYFYLDLIGFAIAACGIIVMEITARMLRAQAAGNELLMQQLISEQQHSEFLIQKEAVETVNRKYHDLKHYLTALEAAADREDLRRFAAEMREEIEPFETIQETGNETMNVLLAGRIRECQMKKIRFIPYVDGRKLDLLSTVDLCTLFGNAMDNAIEASEKIQVPEEREISVKIENFRDLLIFRFTNCCIPSEEKIQAAQVLPTTKPDPDSHGYGLPAIRRIAEKYGGSMSVSKEDTMFELVVMIPDPAG